MTLFFSILHLMRLVTHVQHVMSSPSIVVPSPDSSVCDILWDWYRDSVVLIRPIAMVSWGHSYINFPRGNGWIWWGACVLLFLSLLGRLWKQPHAISAGRPGCMAPHAITEMESETDSNLESGSYVLMLQSQKMNSTACEVQLQNFRSIVAWPAGCTIHDAWCLLHGLP